MNTERINYIARIVQNAFWDIRDKINTLNSTYIRWSDDEDDVMVVHQ